MRCFIDRSTEKRPAIVMLLSIVFSIHKLIAVYRFFIILILYDIYAVILKRMSRLLVQADYR